MASAIEKIANNSENYDEIDEIYPWQIDLVNS
jgi:hypothetical protein